MFIYTLSGITSDFKSHRTYGFMPTAKECINALKKNKCGFDECIYRYFVIEKFGTGFYSFRLKEYWYEEISHNKFVKIKKPKQSNGIVNWGMG